MPRPSHHNDPIGAAARRSKAARRIGINARCACGESRPLALITGSTPMICAECQRIKEGRSIYDNHHIAGKANHCLTIPVPANDHRAILSELQYTWSKAARENASSSPLVAIAGCIRGVYDVIVYLLDKLLLWGAEFLERLDAFLTSRLGPQWWRSPECVAFMKEGK
jgi:hypothetical protein